MIYILLVGHPRHVYLGRSQTVPSLSCSVGKPLEMTTDGYETCPLSSQRGYPNVDFRAGCLTVFCRGSDRLGSFWVMGQRRSQGLNDAPPLLSPCHLGRALPSSNHSRHDDNEVCEDSPIYPNHGHCRPCVCVSRCFHPGLPYTPAIRVFHEVDYPYPILHKPTKEGNNEE